MKGDKMKRRTFLRLATGGSLLLLGGGVAVLGGGKTSSLLRTSRSVMGTRATIVFAHPSPNIAAVVMQAAFDEIAQVERTMSRFRTDSDVGRLNARRETWLTVTAATANVLRRALDIADLSEGYFDPCLDELISRWGFHDHNYPHRIPVPTALLHPSKAPFYQGLTYRRRGQQKQFRLTSQSPGIDLGGIAKGYAIDQAARRLREGGVRHALINVGDDALALGGNPDGGPWRVGIRHPRQPGRLLQVLALREQAVATSGDYANYFTRRGRRFAHLLDPHSGRPAETHRSLTVIAPTAMLADALATAAFTSPPAKLPDLLTSGGATGWLAVDAAGLTHGSAV